MWREASAVKKASHGLGGNFLFGGKKSARDEGADRIHEFYGQKNLHDDMP
jgi:hypothetical protein